MSYFSSLPGRALLASAGLFLLGPGIASVIDSPAASIRLFAIFPLLGASAAIISAGVGMFQFPRQTLNFILYLPIILWLTWGGFTHVALTRSGVGVGILLASAVLIIAAARPASGAKPGEFTASAPSS